MDNFDDETQSVVNEIARTHRLRSQIGARIIEYINENPPPREERIERMSVHTSALRGMNWIMELVYSNNIRIYNKLRMSAPVYLRLCATLKENYGLTDSQRFSHKESVAIFLFVIAHGHGYRQATERFQRSSYTISVKFHKVLECLLAFTRDQINPVVNTEVHPHIRNNTMYFPHFKDCIGGIDGTHVCAVIPQDQAVPFIGRKGMATQNVVGVCDFNMCFTFVSTGWEGSMHDARILGNILRDPVHYGFPTPPNGKYYLVDSGYTNMKGYLEPYKGERYHLHVFRNGDPPRNAQEIFNRWHASLRSVIERTFRVWKTRFKVLNSMSSFIFKDQAKLVAVIMALHNFIRRSDHNDRMFRPNYSLNLTHNDEATTSMQMRADSYMTNVRDEICESICGIGE